MSTNLEQSGYPVLFEIMMNICYWTVCMNVIQWISIDIYISGIQVFIFQVSIEN